MKSINLWWLMSKYSAVKNSDFLNVGLQAYNFGVPVYKGIIIPPYMKWNLFFHNDYSITILLYGQLDFLRVIMQSDNFGVPVYKGVRLSKNEMKCIILWWLLSKYFTVQNFYIAFDYITSAHETYDFHLYTMTRLSI